MGPFHIDATPGSMDAFRRLRPRDINLEVAIGNAEEELTYYLLNEPALNTLSREVALSRDGLRSYKIVAEIPLKTRTLGSILDEYLPQGQRLDFLNIDVEGFDITALSSNDWSKYRPPVVLVDDAEATIEGLAGSPIAELLRRHGYRLFAKTGFTLIFRLS